MNRPGGTTITTGPAERNAPTAQAALVCIHRRWPVLLLAALTVGLLSLLFEPFALWPIAYVALVPWLVAVMASRRTAWTYLISFLAGAAFFGFNLHWLVPITGLGYAALLPYLGVYLLLAAWGIRLLHRRCWVPASLSVPIFWVGSEYLRGWVITGFPWFLLSHSHYRVLTTIQVCDLVGAYGLSFVLAMVNGWLAEAITLPIWRWPRAASGPRKRLLVGGVATLLAVLGTLLYGQWQLSRQTIYDGPVVTVAQRNYPSFVDLDAKTDSPEEMYQAYVAMIDQAVEARGDIDLVVLPESAVWAYLNRGFRENQEAFEAVGFLNVPRSLSLHERTERLVKRIGRTLVLGAASVQIALFGEELRLQRYNSAFVYCPGRSQPGRYDKMHLVLFGEYVPFRYTKWHWLYEWLNSLTPWGQHFEYSNDPGQWPTVFTLNTRGPQRRAYRFAVPICYEDVMPEVARTLVRGGGQTKQADFLLNISNDGWFKLSSELPQHLAICVFRAVEHRVGVARAVNTGLSALIGPEGRIDACLGRGQIGTLTGVLRLDRRVTLYTRWGDWLGRGCQVLAVFLLVLAKVVGMAEWLRRRTTATARGKA